MAAPEAGQGPSAARSFVQTIPWRERKTEPQTRQAKSLSERSQDDRACRRHGGREARVARQEIDKGLVNDEEISALGEMRRECGKIGRRHEPSVRIVGIDDDGDIGVRQIFEARACLHIGPRPSPASRMFAIGEAQHADAAGADQLRQPLDQRLRPRRRHDARGIRNAIEIGRRLFEPAQIVFFRQSRKSLGRKIGRIGMGARGSRKIEPRLERVRKKTARFGEIAAVAFGG